MLDTDTPTAFTNHETTWNLEDEEIQVELWKTPPSVLSSLRAIAYLDTDVFLLGYDMTSPTSLQNIPQWLEEINDHQTTSSAVILVGTKYDLWLEMKEAGDDQICTETNIAAVISIKTCIPDD